jgi:hypothetical protein
MATSWWLLAASLAPVCVKCHHAGCVITCRVRASAGAILAAALIASDSVLAGFHLPRIPGRRSADHA